MKIKRLKFEMKLHTICVRMYGKLVDMHKEGLSKMKKLMRCPVRFNLYRIYMNSLTVMIRIINRIIKKLTKHLGKQLNVDVGEL